MKLHGLSYVSQSRRTRVEVTTHSLFRPPPHKLHNASQKYNATLPKDGLLLLPNEIASQRKSNGLIVLGAAVAVRHRAPLFHLIKHEPEIVFQITQTTGIGSWPIAPVRSHLLVRFKVLGHQQCQYEHDLFDMEGMVQISGSVFRDTQHVFHRVKAPIPDPTFTTTNIVEPFNGHFSAMVR